MPLTRHLYRPDEVAAALLWSIGRGRCTEAAFWALELEDSGYGPTLCETTLFLAWTHCISFAVPSLLLETGPRSERAYKLALASTRGKKDATIHLLLEGAFQPDRVGLPPLGPLEELYEEGSKELFLIRSLLQGKLGSAWAVLQEFKELPWTLFASVASWKHAGQPQIREILESIKPFASSGAVAVAILSVPAKTLSFTPIQCNLSDYLLSIDIWDSLIGHRARRIYSIPPECLVWAKRTASTESELTLSLEEGLEGSPWWEECKIDALAQAEGDEDEARMLLYDTAFPDDIPDEWSSAERAKSHGRGSHQTTTERFWRNILGPSPSSTVLWIPAGPSIEESILNFAPIKRRNFVILEE